MTVLQKIIKAYQDEIDRCDEPDCNVCADCRDDIDRIKLYLSDEEQQIRDAFEAGEYYNSKREYAEPPPNFKTYLTHLQTK